MTRKWTRSSALMSKSADAARGLYGRPSTFRGPAGLFECFDQRLLKGKAMVW
jgi:hypothetical protein